MSHDEQYIIPSIRTFKIESIAQVDEKSKLNIHRLFMPSETNSLSSKNDNFDKVTRSFHISEQDIKFLAQQPIQKPASHHEQYHPSSSSVPDDEQQAAIVPIDEHQQASSDVPIEQYARNTNKAATLSSVKRVERPLSPPLSQLLPDSIINDKQATKRIFNEKNSTLFLPPSKHVTLTPINFSSKKTTESINNNDDKSSNHVRYYQIGSIFTSTSSLIMHQNKVIAQATTSDTFLSDTIFIIIITTLTIIILLFCFGLFCLCRRTTKRTISPSFDGASYAALNGHSFEMPISDGEQRISKYENNIPYRSSSIQTKPSINHPQPINDRILLPQTVALHHTAKQKAQMSKNKLKKKRVGFCCCRRRNSIQTTVNGQTRIKRTEM